MTNDSKLLEKVLSKYRQWDIAYVQFEGHDKETKEGLNQIVVPISALSYMETQARAEGYEEGTYNDFIAFMHEYDLPDSQLTKGGQLFRDKLIAVRDRIYKKAQADLFKELEDELNKKLNNQHFRTTDFKFIAGYREAIKEMLQALKSSKGIE